MLVYRTTSDASAASTYFCSSSFQGGENGVFVTFSLEEALMWALILHGEGKGEPSMVIACEVGTVRAMTGYEETLGPLIGEVTNPDSVKAMSGFVWGNEPLPLREGFLPGGHLMQWEKVY